MNFYHHDASIRVIESAYATCTFARTYPNDGILLTLLLLVHAGRMLLEFL